MMDGQQFKLLSEKMDTIIRLLALNAVEGKQLKDQVQLLSSFGFQPKQIADMLCKTPNHIRVLLHELRKEKEKVKETLVKEIASVTDEKSLIGQKQGDSDA